MNAVFADTFYFLALLNPSDKTHQRSLEFTTAFQGRLVTTAWVLTELADALCRPPDRERIGQFIERLRTKPEMRLAAAEEALFDAGFQLYRQRPDKEWSLTDCISFVVMQREAITEALTGDHHFEQAGFIALLK
jgi:predicted nucleic acid-binding protein